MQTLNDSDFKKKVISKTLCKELNRVNGQQLLRILFPHSKRLPAEALMAGEMRAIPTLLEWATTRRGTSCFSRIRTTKWCARCECDTHKFESRWVLRPLFFIFSCGNNEIDLSANVSKTESPTARPHYTSRVDCTAETCTPIKSIDIAKQSYRF